MKANSNLAICYSLIKEGCGLDIVSGGELYKALKIGCPSKRIVYASVGKKSDEIVEGIRRGILLFNVESIPELSLIDELAGKMNKKIDVSIRLNPQIRIPTHDYIATANEETKFGLDFGTARDIFLNRKIFKNLNLCGLHIHIGSQITQPQPFVKAIEKVVLFIEELKELKIDLKWLNIGGGLGITYKDERPQTAKEFSKKILPLIRDLNLKIILEPGRFIVGNSGILVTRIIYIKETPHKNFIICDAGMNDLIRPALYGAYHQIIPLELSKNKKRKYDIVGPLCESADFLGKDRILFSPKEGDFLAIMGAGAYGFSMSSNYNSRPRCSEVLVIKNNFYIIRKAENYRDLIRGEIIPPILMN